MKNTKGAGMELIPWSEQLAVNIPEVDDQHRRLVVFLNGLHKAMKDGSVRERIQEIVEDLRAYAIYHFDAEEKLMEQSGYPDLEGHSAEHGFFVREMDRFRDEVEAGRFQVALEVLHFLPGWVRDHLGGIDQKYADHISRQAGEKLMGKGP
jgi:hemerythrin-like metal-binding protein